MTDALNQTLLPEGYFAEEQMHPISRLEIDVATFEQEAAEQKSSGGLAVAGRKTCSCLHAGVSLIVIDVVTERLANLHNDLMQMLGDAAVACVSTAQLYAVAYRPVLRNDERQVEMWPTELAVGKPMPELPLWIAPDIAVPVNLEIAYQDACGRRRITL